MSTCTYTLHNYMCMIIFQHTVLHGMLSFVKYFWPTPSTHATFLLLYKKRVETGGTVHSHVFIHMSTYIYIHTCICIHPYIDTYIHVYVYIYMYIYMYVYIYIHLYLYLYLYLYTCIYIPLLSTCTYAQMFITTYVPIYIWVVIAVCFCVFPNFMLSWGPFTQSIPPSSHWLECGKGLLRRP